MVVDFILYSIGLNIYHYIFPETLIKILGIELTIQETKIMSISEQTGISILKTNSGSRMVNKERHCLLRNNNS